MFYNSYGQQQEEYIRNAFMGGLLFQNQFYGNTYGSSYYCPCGNALGNQYAGGCSPEVVYSMIQQALNPVISVLVAHLKECQSLQSKCSHCKVHIEQPSQYVEPEVEQEPEPEPELEPEPEPCEVEEYYEEGPGPTLVLASSFAETKPFTPKLEIHHPKADMIKVIDFEAEEEKPIDCKETESYHELSDTLTTACEKSGFAFLDSAEHSMDDQRAISVQDFEEEVEENELERSPPFSQPSIRKSSRYEEGIIKIEEVVGEDDCEELELTKATKSPQEIPSSSQLPSKSEDLNTFYVEMKEISTTKLKRLPKEKENCQTKLKTYREADNISPKKKEGMSPSTLSPSISFTNSTPIPFAQESPTSNIEEFQKEILNSIIEDHEMREEDTEEEKLQIHSDPTDSEVISQVNKESPKTPPARRGRFKFASLWEAGTEDSFWFNRININHFN
eukprot:TRINITY_DN633_c0_g2_i7.p1 TRINITY_DN633_c0_g2~~TRINITY_DN633_c0_g2_i7.p1  ORF type:complete len:447 (-),score=82.86 TRINITY_DN633_c0_g2_i7:123-1463(-)